MSDVRVIPVIHLLYATENSIIQLIEPGATMVLDMNDVAFLGVKPHTPTFAPTSLGHPSCSGAVNDLLACLCTYK